MTASSRVNYGSDIWAKALERTGRRPYGITPFATSLKLSMQGKRDSLWRDSTFRSLVYRSRQRPPGQYLPGCQSVPFTGIIFPNCNSAGCGRPLSLYRLHSIHFPPTTSITRITTIPPRFSPGKVIAYKKRAATNGSFLFSCTIRTKNSSGVQGFWTTINLPSTTTK